MTQEEVAQKIGVTRNTVQNWESTYTFRNKKDLHLLMDLYNANPTQRAMVLTLAYGDAKTEAYDFAVLANEAIDAYEQVREALINALDSLHVNATLLNHAD